MLRSHSEEAVQHMQPKKTGVKTNVNDDKRFWEDDLKKNILKQINKIKAATAV